VAKIYRLDDSTLYLCEPCLDSHGPVPGKWDETPLETCSVCGEIDLQSREEMDEYHHHMSNLQYEDQYGDGRFDDDPNPYHGTYNEN
jgi:hypothetical protein